MPAALHASVLTGRTSRTRLGDRTLLDAQQATELAVLFKVLASDTRLRLLHAVLRSGEICVTDLAEAVGVSVQAVSNQLARLVDRGVVATRRDGLRIYYRITDPCIPILLDRGMCLVEELRQRKR